MAKSTHEQEANGSIIYLDGRIAGMTGAPDEFIARLRAKRRAGSISASINVAWDSQFEQVHVNTDAGRLQRPLIVLENGKPKLTAQHAERVERGETKWNDLLAEGVIEYLDAEEENNALVALRLEDATKKVRLAEDAWNSKDPLRVSLAYTPDSRWRNRNEFLVGRGQIVIHFASADEFQRLRDQLCDRSRASKAG